MRSFVSKWWRQKPVFSGQVPILGAAKFHFVIARPKAEAISSEQKRLLRATCPRQGVRALAMTVYNVQMPADRVKVYDR